MPIVGTLHLWLVAGAAIAGAIVVLALGVGAVASGSVSRGAVKRTVDRAVLAAELVVLLGVATGLIQLVTGSSPADGLHFLYAALAVWALPVARAWRGFATGPRLLPMAIGALALLGFLLRLYQTGGG